jgi:uncharacterized membrane protein
MKTSVIFRLIAAVVLVIFTFTSCIEPSVSYNYSKNKKRKSNNTADIASVPVGKGDIRIVFLDGDYQPAAKDTGRLAMYVENNELAEEVLVLGEIRNNNIYNDIVVRVINKENDSLVSFFYHANERFPYKIAISAEDEEIAGNFSLYDELTETYSLEFFSEEGERELFDNLVLNKNVFDLYKDDSNLTETQNARLRNIITSLAIWNSLAFQLDDEFTVNARGIFSNFFNKLKKVIKIVIAVVAVVAFVAVCIICPPATVTIAGIGGISLTMTGAAAIATAAVVGVGLIINHFIPSSDELKDKTKSGDQITPPPPPGEPPMVEITVDGKKVDNKQEPPYYLAKDKSITFDLTFTLFSDAIIRDVIYDEDLKEFIYPYEPGYGRVVYGDRNSGLFNELDVRDPKNYLPEISPLNQISSNSYQCTIKFKRTESGHVGDGNRLQFIIPFKKTVIINDDSKKGVNFDGNAENKKVFIFNFAMENDGTEPVIVVNN